MADSASGPLLVVLSAPSGGGKTTVCQRLLKIHPNLVRAITCTTRPPRDGERDGVDYYFLDAGDFLKRVQAGNFLEHATVYGNSYGTLKSEVLGKLRHNQDVLLTVDVQGAATIRAKAIEDPELKRSLVTVFLAPASLAVLQARLQKRGNDSPAAVKKRLSVAKQEIGQAKHFDYIIPSRSIDEDVDRMESILRAEKLRQGRVPIPVYD